MKKIAISQPRYLPAAVYIERMIISDVFVLLDNVQHQKRAYEHRNKIRTSNGTTWLSIPIDRKNSKTAMIKDLLIFNENNWQENHLKNFKFNYKKTPYYDEIILMLEEYYSKNFSTLNQAVSEMLRMIIDYLGIEVELKWASNYDFKFSSDDLLLEITEYFHGNVYISGANGRNYLDEKKFNDKSIKVKYHDYKHPVYEQIWGDFKEYMTIWDMMFYFGKQTKDKIFVGHLNNK